MDYFLFRVVVIVVRDVCIAVGVISAIIVIGDA
jgi:hypothetical protein